MPAKTKRDEKKWQKAKGIAKEKGRGEDYSYIMGVYKRMKPDYFKDKKAKGKYEGIDFKPPASVAKAAERGLEYRRRQKGDKAGLTPSEAAKEGIGSGVQRATNLKNRDTISPEVIRQMSRFFSRHEKNKAIDPKHKGEPWKDKGYVAWLLWGGDPGKAWAEKVLRQMESRDKPDKTAFDQMILRVAQRHAEKVARRWPRPTERKPSERQLMEWSMDSVVEATDGCRVEPDGVCPHGHPSWLLYMGWI